MTRKSFFGSFFFIRMLDFWVFSLHRLVENLNVGKDRFPVGSVQGHHIIHVQQRIDPELLICHLESNFEVLSSGLRREFVDGDFSGAEMVDESGECHAIGPGAGEVLDIDVSIADGFVLDPEQQRLFDEIRFRSKVFVLSFLLLLRSAPGLSLELDHSGPYASLLHPRLLVDGLNRLHHLREDVQPVAGRHVDAVDHARHGD